MVQTYYSYYVIFNVLVLEIYKDSEHYAGYEVWDSFLCKLDDGGYGFAYIVDVHYESEFCAFFY